MLSEPSLRAHENLCGTLISCTYALGWRSLLLRGYVDPPVAEEVTTAATPDHLIVLVTAGACAIESHGGGRWHRASYRPGNLGMTAPGQQARLRWASEQPHSTLHLHLPAQVVQAVAAELTPSSRAELPNLLSQTDPVIVPLMLALEGAARQGAPDLYAESAAQFLAAHLLARHARTPAPEHHRWRSHALQQADRFLREHLSEPVSLGELARAVGLSPFQFLRAARAVWGETPLRRLTRLRMELAQDLLRQGLLPVSEIAFKCGYGNPSHFATAFRRQVGLTPGRYRHETSG